ncbi:protein FAM53C-like [Anguilla anguilla]|nr:protein FAM53C-like [Anguilla anguilla]XP_035290511.1 protein FAM53C-like [Anguilla anguilla]XP_035290513.1 protein FAM53C-like [Anguilla anguilla]XP_035290514.1 protein FAM53C-like [Anguilla anguilla]
MVTLITEQLRKQSLSGHAHLGSFSLYLPLPEPPSPGICWPTYGLMPESSYWQLCPPSKPSLQGVLSSSFPPGPVPLGPPALPFPEGDAPDRALVPSTSATNLSLPGAPPPPPPPPKRHCRSLSVPEDLSRCRYTWRPSASRIWTPVKRRCHSGGGAGGSCPLRGAPPSSSLNSSGQSSSSPTFCSLALSPESPLPWAFPWDPPDVGAVGGGGGGCCCFFPAPSSSSCSSSPSPLRPPPHHPHRRFSLSPVHIREAAAHFLPPPPPPAPPQPWAPPVAVPPSPSSACSTPSSLRRATPLQLPRCHSQPCDLLLRKPGLKRRRDPDTLPRARPGLDFIKMTQTRSGEALSWLERGRLGCGGDVFMGLEPFLGDFRGSVSPAEGLGRSSIGPLSESEEEEEEEEEDDEEEEEERESKSDGEGAQQSVFERDCTELDLTLIEEN